MKYLTLQYKTVHNAVKCGKDIREILPIKYYVQHLMAEQIERYLKPTSSILEVGCGGSLALHFLNLKGYKATGIDNDYYALKYSHELCDIFDSNVSFLNANAFELPFKDKQFDYVYSVGMIEHYPFKKQRKLFNEMLRVTCKFIHIEIPNSHPFSTFYTVGLESQETHMQCNPGILMNTNGCSVIEIEGRCVFDILDRINKNPPLYLFVQEHASHLLRNIFTPSDIPRLCEAERAVSLAERLVYGFQLCWVGRRNWSGSSWRVS